MNISRFLAWTALVAGLATAPTPTSAQVGRFIKKKMKEKVEQTVAVPDSAAANSAAPVSSARGPVFTSDVLEITPELLDRLEKAWAAKANAREENARGPGKVLPPEEYQSCKERALGSPEGQRVTQEMLQLMGEATTQEQMQRAMEEANKRMEAFLEPECGLEPYKADHARVELARRVATAGEEASGLTDRQLSILEERILPLCTVTGIADADGVRIPTEDSDIFYVYTPSEVEALRPRCGKLVEVLQAEG
jgi:hypothetical protein